MIELTTNAFNQGATLSALFATLASLYFVVLGAWLCIVDIKEHRLPNKLNAALVLGGLVLLIALAVSLPDSLQDSVSVLMMLVAGLGYSVLMFILHVISRGGVGMGDVKLAVGLGLYTGFLGWESAFAAVVFAFVIGGVVALFLMLIGKATAKTQIAFGPAMIAGACVPLFLIF